MGFMENCKQNFKIFIHKQYYVKDVRHFPKGLQQIALGTFGEMAEGYRRTECLCDLWQITKGMNGAALWQCMNLNLKGTFFIHLQSTPLFGYVVERGLQGTPYCVFIWKFSLSGQYMLISSQSSSKDLGGGSLVMNVTDSNRG